MTASRISAEDLEACLRVLQTYRELDRTEPDFVRIDQAVQQAYRRGRKENRRYGREQRRARDLAREMQTGRFQAYPDHPAFSMSELPKAEELGDQLERPRHCYVCKSSFQKLHFFYHYLCPNCAEFGYQQRVRRGNLHGRCALVTGGRIKIGFELVLKLLRDGAAVWVTTRFPNDALQKFAKVEDYEEFKSRLTIVGLDLRYLPNIANWVQALVEQGQTFDILINNAAQTVHRPPTYYRALAEGEQAVPTQLLSDGGSELPIVVPNGSYLPQFYEHCLANQQEPSLFPIGMFTEEGVPLDLRTQNSWVLDLAQVPLAEMIETQLINAMAPFVLVRQMRPAMEKSSFSKRFIINVAATEGQFSAKSKTTRHPHTNMAKAGLNMMTRTSAADFIKAGIYMNSVDTGWVTYEVPWHAKNTKETKGFHTPLDVIDGAARIYTRILDGIEGDEQHGLLFKDYKVIDW
jgi:NAD(P)-dependent dehydrogenase (short-subunit alcohol dehydrogenase family)